MFTVSESQCQFYLCFLLSLLFSSAAVPLALLLATAGLYLRKAQCLFAQKVAEKGSINNSKMMLNALLKGKRG